MGQPLQIIGIAGTNGSGKDTVGHLIAATHNYLFVSVSDLLREEARKRNLPITREVLRTISAEWRREFGLGVLVDKAVEHCETYGDKYAGVVACPMRNTGEAQHLKDLGGTLIWIDADPKIRYQRIQTANRGRSGEDDKTYDEFLAEEATEMKRSGDEATLNVGDIKAIADIFLANDDGDLAALEQQIDRALDLPIDKI
jgi:cytidylate kinase